MLKQYIRNKFGNPIGVMLADLVDGELEMGYALCCKKDRYDKAKGLRIATHRLNYKGILNNIPHSIQAEYDRFENRAMKYFKLSVEDAFQ